MTVKKNYLKTFDNLACKNVSYNKLLIDATCKDNDDKLLKQFVDRFFSYLPFDYLSKNKDDIFIKLAKDAYNFFSHRKGSERKIEITNSEDNGKSFIAIKILTTDKPFIIDSLKAMLARIGQNVKFLFHPVIKTKRNNNGNLISIGENDSIDESLVSMIIYTKEYDNNIREYLENQIVVLMNKVESTYESWPSFLSKIDEISKDIENKDEENYHFLQWIRSDNFTFLGYVHFNSKNTIINSIGDKEICDSSAMVEHKENEPEISLGQINKISPVHKNSYIDYVKIRSGKEAHIFLGLYGSNIYYQSIQNIPILRQKLESLLNDSGFARNGYNAKKLRSIAESLPREFLFHTKEDQLYCMTMHILSSMASRNLKMFILPDNSGEFCNILIFLPRIRLSPDVHLKINSYLSDQFKTAILTDYIKEIEKDFCYLYITFPISDMESFDIDIQQIENDIDNISAYWIDATSKAVSQKYAEADLAKLTNYIDIFPKEYQYKYDSNQAVSDIAYISSLNDQQDTLFNLIFVDSNQYKLKIYAQKKQSLSDLIPLIENLGFKAIDEQVFELQNSIHKMWLYEFDLTADHISSSNTYQDLKHNVEDALDKMYKNLLPVDSLCKLVVLAGFNWRKLVILKGITRYLHQTGFAYGKGYVQLVLIGHYEYTSKLLSLFESKFNPAKISDEEANKTTQWLNEYLTNVSSSAEDKVLHSMMHLISAMTRTNCYQQDNNGNYKHYISFKFSSSKIYWLALPKPYAEIFVYSNNFEGVHLRGGKVARGGIRWSDRGEDYRTEVLGLMKAQMTKNSVIVPTGSKGGFFVRANIDSMNKEEYMKHVIECYKNFLRGLLDLTDNLVNHHIVTPENLVIYDEKDPYLVVAADKGTATFSDYANSVSSEYNFWLGDAFASGGSAGYDHKKMAITARGAWISVANHFSTMGRDVQKDPITVVGIGDMSGDVFGNGMLLSKSIKLVAAFNHMHIFLDPNPDPKLSFDERERLFNTPGSKWSDYNPSLISKGGGVFSRSSKILHLTNEVMSLLGTNKQEVEPDELINIILKAKVDLLWNGGIGTYIKASSESNLEIGDRSNDSLRCNGQDVGAKVIGEGGNLGMSQSGRIEYSKNGGKVNTDFIDNSAGVDCSDHEVNIKIAMQHAITKGKISLEERNEILSKMTDEVAELVLLDNFKQNQALTISEKSNAFNVEMFGRFISYLEQKNMLDRAVEFLPSEAEITKRSSTGEKMTRPELAVLLSYGKMMVSNELTNSKLADEEFFEPLLISYFPKFMQTKFKEEILSHHLKREIIITMIANKMVNELGGATINMIQTDTGALMCDIVRSYAIVSAIFDLDNLWKQVEDSSADLSSDIQIEMFTDLGKVLRRGISWFIKNLDHPIAISSAISFYAEPAKKINALIGTLILGNSKTKLETKTNYYINHNAKPDLAKKISLLDSLISIFDIIFVSDKTKIIDIEIAKLYFEVGDRFNIDWLRKACEKQINDSYWNKLSIQAIKDDLYDKQRRLLIKIAESQTSSLNLTTWLDKHSNLTMDFINFVDNLKLQENIDLNMMILANKKFEIFLRKV